MTPFGTAPLEQESESSTIALLVPDDVLRIPLAYWPMAIGAKRILGESVCRKRLNVLRFETWIFFFT